jgi:CspA family cold shock protein
MRGTVKWFDEQRGFGFIAGPDATDYFVHYSAIQTEGFRTLAQYDEVSFEPGEGRSGKAASAIQVRKIEG